MTQQFYSRSIQAVPNLKKHWLTGLKYFSWEVLQFKKKKILAQDRRRRKKGRRWRRRRKKTGG